MRAAPLRDKRNIFDTNSEMGSVLNIHTLCAGFITLVFTRVSEAVQEHWRAQKKGCLHNLKLLSRPSRNSCQIHLSLVKENLLRTIEMSGCEATGLGSSTPVVAFLRRSFLLHGVNMRLYSGAQGVFGTYLCTQVIASTRQSGIAIWVGWSYGSHIAAGYRSNDEALACEAIWVGRSIMNNTYLLLPMSVRCGVVGKIDSAFHELSNSKNIWESIQEEEEDICLKIKMFDGKEINKYPAIEDSISIRKHITQFICNGTKVFD
nr:hypothetical protein Iba_chr05eCG6750 [Ipomoea batatas]